MLNQLAGLVLRHTVLLVFATLVAVGVVNREAIFGLQSDGKKTAAPKTVPGNGRSPPEPAAPRAAPEQSRNRATPQDGSGSEGSAPVPLSPGGDRAEPETETMEQVPEQTPAPAEEIGAAGETSDASSASKARPGSNGVEAGKEPDDAQPPEFRFRPMIHPAGNAYGRSLLLSDARRGFAGESDNHFR